MKYTNIGWVGGSLERPRNVAIHELVPMRSWSVWISFCRCGPGKMGFSERFIDWDSFQWFWGGLWRSMSSPMDESNQSNHGIWWPFSGFLLSKVLSWFWCRHSIPEMWFSMRTMQEGEEKGALYTLISRSGGLYRSISSEESIYTLFDCNYSKSIL
jgi:hypothetical protein